MRQEFPVVEAAEGVTRQVLASSPELMVVAFRFAFPGAEGARHSHPHVQSTYCASGRFRFFMRAREFEVTAGDSFITPSMELHGCVCIEPGELIDCFTPRRDDFLEPV